MNRIRLVVVIALLVAVAIGAFAYFRDRESAASSEVTAEPAIAVSIDAVDPANEGRLLSLMGELHSASPPVDRELGVSEAGAVVLLRQVEMYQWQEQCVADACGQTPVWSTQLIDSSKFSEQVGHVNPADLPFAATRFDATDIHLGAFAIDPDLLVSELEPVARPVRLGELQPNLAASFRELDGSLYAGDNPLAPAIGDLRVSYRIVPAGGVTLTGVQRAGRLVAVPDAKSTKSN